MIDYDVDDDGLIEIRYLEQLDAIQHDPVGAGMPKNLSRVKHHRSAFPWPEFGMGCPDGICEGYELMRDLDFRDRNSYASGTVNSKWTGGVGWLPIGLGERKFSAKFNGNGYAIINLYISRVGDNETDSTGLFGRTTDESEISNVRLLDVQVSGVVVVGGMVGSNSGRIDDVYVSGNVSGNSEIGGLAGSNLGEISDSSADVSVSGAYEIGGLVGVSDGRVEDSYATGRVSGSLNVGGLLGLSGKSGMIVRSYFTGSVIGTQVLGGLTGRNEGEIMRSYSAGTVSGSTRDSRGYVGGLAGVNHGSVISSYSVAQVSGTISVGGLVGLNGGSITTSYSTGSVDGVQNVGGLTGWNSGAIRAAYATGDVSGESYVGGLSGTNEDGAATINSYAVGGVMRSGGDSNRLGGLSGSNYRATIIDSVWDTQSTRQRRGVGEGSASGVRGGITAQLQTPVGHTGIFSEWHLDVDNADGDFDPTTGRDDVWDFGTSGQYPALKVDFDGDGVASWQEFGDQRACESYALCP